MASFEVKNEKLNNFADQLEAQAKRLENYANSINTISNNLGMKAAAASNIRVRLRDNSKNMTEERSKMLNMASALKQIADRYRRAEDTILGKTSGVSGSNFTTITGQIRDAIKKALEIIKNGTRKHTSCYSVDPVNLNTGNFILENEDLQIIGAVPLIMSRFYNSLSDDSGYMGKGWSTGYDVRLVQYLEHSHYGSDISVVLEDGREDLFYLKGEKYIPLYGVTASLDKTDDQYVYQTLEGDRYLFDFEGRYVRKENSHHVGFQIEYEENRLNRICKDSGESFSVAYNEEGLISSVSDHSGRTCRYEYENGLLVKAVLPDETEYQYSYSPAGKLNRVVNPNGVNAVETEYDNNFRVVLQKFADGTTNRFDYNDADGAVIMEERNGEKSIHYHDEHFWNVKNVFSDGEERFEYNEKGQKVLLVDKNGAETRVAYDDKGNIASIIKPEGTKVSATYNSKNLLLSVTVNGIRQVTNHYNDLGDLISSEDALGNVTEYLYDEKGNITCITYPDGGNVSAEYDDRGNILSVCKGSGKKVVFEYNDLNQLISHTDEKGRTYSYAYDNRGRQISETRPDGESCFYEYDNWGNLIRRTDYDGSVVVNEYNGNNKVTGIIDQEGRRIEYVYDKMWNPSKIKLPNDGVIEYLYDTNNNPISITDPEGNERSYVYDPEGNLILMTDPEGVMVRFERDQEGRIVKRIEADGRETEFGYHWNDEIAYVKDPAGIELHRTFDDAGRLVEEKDSLGRSMHYDYDMFGNIIKVTDEKGLATEYSYVQYTDKIERICYPGGETENFEYDECGNLAMSVDIYGNKLFYTYDQLDRKTGIKDENGVVLRSFEYDLLGRIIAETDMQGNVQQYSYSPTGKLMSVTDATGVKTCYEYDVMDELTSISKQGKGGAPVTICSYMRDRMGRLKSVTDSSGNTEQYKYNGSGSMISKIDADGNEITYGYSENGLLQSISWGSEKETFYEYDSLNRISDVTDWTGVTHIDYDDMGNVVGIVYPDERRLLHEYDQKGNRVKTVYPDGTEMLYSYDAYSKLVGTKRNDVETSYAYDGYGRLTERRISNGVHVSFDYDQSGLLSHIKSSDQEGVTDEIWYGYDVYGRRIREKIGSRDQSEINGEYAYNYDPAGHIQGVSKNGVLLREYGYDVFGNRKNRYDYDSNGELRESEEYQYDPAGRLSAITKGSNKEEYRFDNRGNIVEQIINGNTERRYSYNEMNRLAGVDHKGTHTEYEYNGLGYRTRANRDENGFIKESIYTVDYSKIYDNLMAISNAQMDANYYWGIGLEGYSDDHTEKGWYLTDALGSVIRKADGTETVYSGYYDEFGTGIGGLTNAPGDDEFGYNGFLFNAAAGTYFAQARQYRSYVGIFDAQDRFGGDITMPDTLNRYAYCMQDPFQYTDKSAYWFGVDDLIAGAIGAVGGVAGTFIGDVVDGVTTGKWEWSSWQEYTGAAIGGAAGGVTTLYAGPIAGGAVAGGVGRLTTEGLTYVSDPKGYKKSGWDVLKETAIDTGIGAFSGLVSKGIDKVTKKFFSLKPLKSLSKNLSAKGGVLGWVGKKFSDIAAGRGSKAWSQVSKILKNQHEFIGQNAKAKQLLMKILKKNFGKYIGQEIISKVTSKLNPLKYVWSKGKGWISQFLKGGFLLCAACSGGGSGF